MVKTIRYYLQQFGSYHISTYAASASFFVVTAIFPLLMLVLSIISMTRLSTEDFIDMIVLLMPDSFGPLINEVASNLITSSATALSLSLLVTLWTAGKSMLGLLDGLNAIADVNDTRNFILKRVICIGYMLLLIFAVLVNLALRVFGQRILALLQEPLPYLAQLFSNLMEQRGLTLFLIFTAIFTIIYTVFPSKKLKIYMQLPGAAFTSLAWMGFSWLFSIYVNQIGQFSILYGGLTMMILAMLWLYFCMYIVFIGAVINKLCPEMFWSGYVFFRRYLDIHPLPGRRERN